MNQQDALKRLAANREGFVAYREQVDEELRQQRQERLAQYELGIRRDVLEAYAAGATIGAIKRAYNTKDHRTVKNIIDSGKGEIEAIREAAVEQAQAQQDSLPEWAEHVGDQYLVRVDGDSAVYDVIYTEDGSIMFSTDELLWDNTYTIKNKAVELLDGKLETESAEAGELAAAIRNGL